MVESSRIGKGGVFSHRSVEILLPAIGAEGRGIEGHQRRAAGLSVPHPLDGRVRGCDFVLSPGHKALHPYCVRVAALPAALPRCPDGIILLGITAIHPEQQICPGSHFLKLSGQSRMLRRVLRLPCVKECQNCPGYRGIHTVQHRMVLLRRCSKAIPAPFRLALLVDAEQIGGVVPKEI